MAEIIRGTTPPITVRFNFDASIITTLYLTIAQNGEDYRDPGIFWGSAGNGSAGVVTLTF